jgi:hypothetical protein
LYRIEFDNPIIFGILWSLYNFDDVNFGVMFTGEYITIADEFPDESALVKRFRRIANDPLSYAWGARKYALIGKEVD